VESDEEPQSQTKIVEERQIKEKIEEELEPSVMYIDDFLDFVNNVWYVYIFKFSQTRRSMARSNGPHNLCTIPRSLHTEKNNFFTHSMSIIGCFF
jgi:hypothetical protein